MDTVKSIRVIPLVRKLKQVFEGSTYRIVSRNTLYVRVETSQGIIGEAFGGDEDIYQEKVVEIANEFLAPKKSCSLWKGFGRSCFPIQAYLFIPGVYKVLT